MATDAVSEARRLPNATIDERDPSAVRIKWWVDPAMTYVAEAPSVERAAEIALDQARRSSTCTFKLDDPNGYQATMSATPIHT